MILTCPECSTKYMAKDGSIGPNGRSVSCARCEAVWFVEGVDPDALALEDNEAVLITPKSESEADFRGDSRGESGPEPQGSLKLNEKVEAEPDVQTELPLDKGLATPASVGAHVLLRDKADAEKLAKRRRLIGAIWAVPIIGLIGLAAIAVVKRQDIVSKNPKTATLYSALGMTVKANGLDIRGMKEERLEVDGNMVLRVTGEVVNLTSQAQSSPLVQIRLENRSGEPVADWYVEPGTIPAKKSFQISTDYPAPPIDSFELRYRFAPEDR